MPYTIQLTRESGLYDLHRKTVSLQFMLYDGSVYSTAATASATLVDLSVEPNVTHYGTAAYDSAQGYYNVSFKVARNIVRLAGTATNAYDCTFIEEDEIGDSTSMGYGQYYVEYDEANSAEVANSRRIRYDSGNSRWVLEKYSDSAWIAEYAGSSDARTLPHVFHGIASAEGDVWTLVKKSDFPTDHILSLSVSGFGDVSTIEISSRVDGVSETDMPTAPSGLDYGSGVDVVYGKPRTLHAGVPDNAGGKSYEAVITGKNGGIGDVYSTHFVTAMFMDDFDADIPDDIDIRVLDVQFSRHFYGRCFVQASRIGNTGLWMFSLYADVDDSMRRNSYSIEHLRGLSGSMIEELDGISECVCNRGTGFNCNLFDGNHNEIGFIDYIDVFTPESTMSNLVHRVPANCDLVTASIGDGLSVATMRVFHGTIEQNNSVIYNYGTDVSPYRPSKSKDGGSGEERRRNGRLIDVCIASIAQGTTVSFNTELSQYAVVDGGLTRTTAGDFLCSFEIDSANMAFTENGNRHEADVFLMDFFDNTIGFNQNDYTDALIIPGAAAAGNAEPFPSTVNDIPGEVLKKLLRPDGKFVDEECLIRLDIRDKTTGQYSIPYIKSQRIVYFDDVLGLSFIDSIESESPRYFVKGSTKPAVVRAQVTGDGLDEDPGWDTLPFPFTDIEVSESYFTGTIARTDTQFSKYPYSLHGNSLPEAASEGDGVYSMQLPYGAPPLLARERIVVPEIVVNIDEDHRISIAGEYSLMTFGEVNAELNPTTAYTEATYTGLARIYKYTSGTTYRYIRILSNENHHWCVSETISGTDYFIIGAGSLEAEPENDLGTFSYAYGGEDYIPGMETSTATFTKYPADSENGVSKRLYVRFSDEYGNMTEVASFHVIIGNVGPQNIMLRLTGSSGDSHYTGMYRRPNGSFFPCEYVQASFSAEAGISSGGIKMWCRLAGDVMQRDGEENLDWIELESGVMKTALVKVKPGNNRESAIGKDERLTIYLIVKDEAGNTNESGNGVSPDFAQIQYITKLFRSRHQNLVEETPTDRYSLYSKTGAVISKLLQTKVSTNENEYTRSWNEIWYPSSHGMPLNSDGTIDAVSALRISQPTVDETGVNGPTALELTMYDRLALDSTNERLLKDSEGRYYCAGNDWSVSKTYPANENSRLSGNSFQKCWIIDNSGNVDFRLEFEYFDFSGEVKRLPANLAAPYEGDMLSVYDASPEGAVSMSYDNYGNKVYTIQDSSRLTHLFTLKGSYRAEMSNSFKMIDSVVPGTLSPTDCGFVTPSITTTSLICLVPFTDSGDSGTAVASGFKLKAGPKHAMSFQNYEYNSGTGEFWVHICPESSVSGSWKSVDELLLDYKYYESFATTDKERGLAVFDSRINHTVLGTFTCHLHLDTDGTNHYPYGYFSYYNESNDSGSGHSHCVHTFAATEDDFVDYSEASIYVQPIGTELPSGTYEGSSASGRIALKNVYSLVNDTGILTFLNTVPLGRILGSYYYHTFYRLTSDGYGDLYFYGSGILVPAATTNSYTDWTYVDLKIVNEGTNTLTNGLLQFLARGYITTGTVVDTVLDMNRPWDVQEGTTAETVQRTGARVSTSYSELNTAANSKATRKNAFEARQSQAVSLGTIDPKGTVYVRVFWCIANDANGTKWIDCTRGNKTYSAELSGKFHIFSS